MEVRFPGVPVPWRSKTAAPVPAGFVLVDTDGTDWPTPIDPHLELHRWAVEPTESNKPGGRVHRAVG